MYRVEFTSEKEYLATVRGGGDAEDLKWTPMLQTFEDEQAANDELAWLAMDEGGWVYRVRPVPEAA